MSINICGSAQFCSSATTTTKKGQTTKCYCHGSMLWKTLALVLLLLLKIQKKRNTLFVLEQLTSAKSSAKSRVFLFMIGMKIDTGAQAVCLARDKTEMAFGVL